MQTAVILPPYFQGQSEIETNLEIVYNSISRVGHISEFILWKYMKDVQNDKAVPRLTKINPVTNYNLTELESLINEVDFGLNLTQNSGL